MPPLPRVRPGDLITADFMNSLLDKLDNLEVTVAGLQSGSSSGNAPTITALNPDGTSVNPLREGGALSIAGQNFRFSLGGHRVFFNDRRVDTFKPGSNDSLLLLDVPILGLSATDPNVTLRVENGLDHVDRTVVVQPFPQTLQGDIDVLWRDELSPNPSPNPIVPGQAALFAYTLSSRANLAATYVINPVLSVVAWQNLLQVLDASQSLIGDRQIRLSPNERRNFFVRISSVPSGTVGQTFSLAVSASSGGLTGGDSRGFTVGTPVQPSDDSINLSSPSFSAIDPNTGANIAGASFNTSTNTIRMPVGALATLQYSVTFDQAGSYSLSVQAETGTSGWTLSAVPTQYPDLPAGDTESPRITILATAGASASGQVIFRIQRQGASTDQTRRYTLERIAS